MIYDDSMIPFFCGEKMVIRKEKSNKPKEGNPKLI
jgi:hypothetical protein